MTLYRAIDCSERKALNNDLILDLFESSTPARRNVDRHDVEYFIHEIFARAYDADLDHYLPRLMSLRKNNRIISALGMREASNGRLFLETYLDSPVEQLISTLDEIDVSRHQIVEIGNLASTHRSGLRNLIVALTAYLRGAGAEWVVFTAIPAVRNAFAALNLPLHTLAVADISRLEKQEQEKWGSYYETGPVVVAGRVEDGYRRIRELIDLEKAMSLSCCLWQYAFHAGCKQRNSGLISKTSTVE